VQIYILTALLDRGDAERGEEGSGGEGAAAASGSGGQDWSVVSECFDQPHLVMKSGTLSKALQDVVRSAVSEMRRYYSRKVIDVLIKVTKQSLDALRRRFTGDPDASKYNLNTLGPQIKFVMQFLNQISFQNVMIESVS